MMSPSRNPDPATPRSDFTGLASLVAETSSPDGRLVHDRAIAIALTLTAIFAQVLKGDRSLNPSLAASSAQKLPLSGCMNLQIGSLTGGPQEPLAGRILVFPSR